MVIPPAVRSALVEHAEAESPNEACGVVVLRDGEAERYIPGTNLSESPYRYELQVPPDTWFLEDEGYELAVFHSHVSSPPRPSRTDVENIGPLGGTSSLYLWFDCGVFNGLSAAEFDLGGSGIDVVAFTPMNGFLNAGTATAFLLAVGGCPLEYVVAGRIDVEATVGVDGSTWGEVKGGYR